MPTLPETDPKHKLCQSPALMSESYAMSTMRTEPLPQVPSNRVGSIDAYRGFVMFLMMAEVLGVYWLILWWMYRRKIFLRI
jgi:hypothetical protein